MSMDKGLKPRNALARHRNVLRRDERIEALQEIEQWDEQMSVFGLPKVANRKVVVKKIKTEAKAEEAAAAEGEEGAEGAPPAEGGAPADGAAGSQSRGTR